MRAREAATRPGPSRERVEKTARGRPQAGLSSFGVRERGILANADVALILYGGEPPRGPVMMLRRASIRVERDIGSVRESNPDFIGVNGNQLFAQSAIAK